MSHILTLVASDKSPTLNKNHFDIVTNICAQHGVNLTDEKINWLDEEKAAQINLTDDVPMEAITLLRAMLRENKIDFLVIDEYFKAELLVADMESTIIPHECLDELAKQLLDKESAKEVIEITRQGMNKEIEFPESLRRRVALLRGTPENVLNEKRDALILNPGAEEFVRTLSNDGAFCALITGGFTYFSSDIAEKCGFHTNHANVLDIQNNTMTGNVIDPILDGKAKEHFLVKYSEEKGINLKNSIMTGDGGNDLNAMKVAGLGLGYHPKPVVEKEMKNCIYYGGFEVALYGLGYTRDMFVRPKISNELDQCAMVPQ